MNFTPEQIDKKWRNKKSSCAKRKIPMLLSQEEFTYLYQHHNMVCEYTGDKMSTDHLKDNYISLERIDETLPYQSGNICFITKAANHVKGSMFDHKTNSGIKLLGKHRETFFKLVDVIRDEEYINNLKNKYTQENIKRMMSGDELDIKEQTQFTKGKIMKTTITQHTIQQNRLRKYLKFVDEMEKFGCTVSMSASQFNVKHQRQTCSLSKQPLDHTNPYYLIKDKTQPVTKDNLLIVNQNVGKSIDFLMSKTGLNWKGVQGVYKNLAK
ncbi:MAG: hypothetical protein GY861_13100 [bacterium]|nr:hypothetical protein [bacterium]